nr:unnamed protein product [Spirometra erinaceieuropaei]
MVWYGITSPLPTCPRCQRTFRAPIGLVGHLRINCASRTAPTIVPPPATSSSSPPPTNPDNSSDPPLPSSFSSSSSSSSPTAPTAAAQATVPRTTTDTTTTSPDSRNEDQDYTCPHCDRTFTSHIGLVGHLRIHRTETGKPVREAPTYTHRTRLHCPHCPRTFRHRMGLFGHMRIHESGLDRTPDTPTTSNTSTVHTPALVPSVRTTTTTATSVADTDTTDFSCPHCPRTFTSRIGLVGHLRIHRTKSGEPVPGAPTYTHQARFNYQHCPRTFRHRMGLFGLMRVHDDLRPTFSVKLMDVYRGERPAICMNYRADGYPLNTRRVKARARLSTATNHDMLFADNRAFNSMTEEDIQRTMGIFASDCAHFGLAINTDKTAAMHQHASIAGHSAPRCRANGTKQKTVDNFSYLGGTMSRRIRINDKVAHWISKASQTLRRLQNTVWNRHGLRLNDKLKMCKAVVLKALLYGAKT